MMSPWQSKMLAAVVLAAFLAAAATPTAPAATAPAVATTAVSPLQGDVQGFRLTCSSCEKVPAGQTCPGACTPLTVDLVPSQATVVAPFGSYVLRTSERGAQRSLAPEPLPPKRAISSQRTGALSTPAAGAR